MEELLFGLGLAGEELDVVDEKHVRVPVGLFEAIDRSRPERSDEVVGERLDGRVSDDRAAAEREHVVADGVEEVRLAEARRGVEEQRVVGLAGKLRDRQRRGVGEAIAVADDELVEAVAGVQRAGGEVEALGLGARSVRAIGTMAGELELDVRTECDSGAALEDPPEALGDPVVRRHRCVDEQRAAIHGPHLQRRQPDLVRGLADCPPELRTELTPGNGGLEVRGQRQATPCGTEMDLIAREAPEGRPGRRIYQR